MAGQYAGRLHRPQPGKHDALVYDYVDTELPVLRRMFAKRLKTYHALGYELIERRGDGSPLLRPDHEHLSDVLCETEGQVFRDDEFAAHLERVAASEDDLPTDPPA